MKNILILFVFLLSACASQVDKKQEVESLDLVQSWLQAIDNENIDKVWELTSNITKARFEKEVKAKYWLGIRKPMGKVIHRNFQLNWKLELFQGNIPDGTHRDVRYWSKYENREFAKERFVVTLEEGKWRLLEWYVK